MGIADGEVAEEDNGRNGMVSVVHPYTVVNTGRGVVDVGCAAKSVGGAYTEIIVLIPIRVGARANVTVGSLVLGADHGFAEASRTIVSEVARQAAVAYGKEVLVGIGQLVDVAVGELGLIPHVVVAVGGVVDETDARAQGIVAARILALVHMRVDLGESVGRIIIIGGGVINGGCTDA